ncbi:hypothetical protein CKAH01_11324 [Colletotrichum kahawae]|uniref:Uncharacterized protein n=1 Tax=Colletotrichum kahawae TaxID=34407 RepID=A0AAD9YVD8_COLKA|nr:hypothetical protein CKAH01_11324 [Colletotrichum kahawae]
MAASHNQGCQPLKCLSRNRSGELNGYSKGDPEQSPGSVGSSLTARGPRTNGLAEPRGLPLNLKPPPLEWTRLLEDPSWTARQRSPRLILSIPHIFTEGPRQGASTLAVVNGDETDGIIQTCAVSQDWGLPLYARLASGGRAWQTT